VSSGLKKLLLLCGTEQKSPGNAQLLAVISIRRFSSYFIDLHRDKLRRTEQGKRFDWSCI
jgi:hypothetical protein